MKVPPEMLRKTMSTKGPALAAVRPMVIPIGAIREKIKRIIAIDLSLFPS